MRFTRRLAGTERIKRDRNKRMKRYRDTGRGIASFERVAHLAVSGAAFPPIMNEGSIAPVCTPLAKPWSV